MERKIRLGIVCDNQIFHRGLVMSIATMERYNIVISSSSDSSLKSFVNEEDMPELFLVCVGNSSLEDMEAHINSIKIMYPAVKVLLMSNYNNQYSVAKAFKYGANGLIAKSCTENELHRALLSIYYTDTYYHDGYEGIRFDITNAAMLELTTDITDLERTALSYFATEMSYKEISETMNCSLETVEAYRDLLFDKFNVSSRIGLVIWAHAIGELHVSRKAI